MHPLDVGAIKQDFPILGREINGKRLVYLDSASSSQKPNAVLDAMDDMYRTHYANIHRGVYTIAEQATAAYEGARRKVARFVNAHTTEEIIFTRNTTESINLVAYSWARANLRAGDVIVLSHMEHHANVVPWHILAAERGVELRWIPLTTDYRLDTSKVDELLDGAKLLAIERDVERARHDQRRPHAHATGTGRGRPRARRRLPVRARTSPRTSGSGTPTSSPSRRTSCSGRPASARCGPGGSSSRRCPRSSAAER